jgi:transposase-like protein
MKAKTIKFPQTLHECIRYFADEDRALGFMKSIRWPDGAVKCPRCQSEAVSFLATRKLWKCKGCAKQFSIKVGTVMEDSAISLDKWLCAFWLIANAKNGISSYELHRSLGLTQKTAWFLLHRIRLAMQEGTVEKIARWPEKPPCLAFWNAIRPRSLHGFA